jgi:hypothetical protein
MIAKYIPFAASLLAVTNGSAGALGAPATSSQLPFSYQPKHAAAVAATIHALPAFKTTD